MSKQGGGRGAGAAAMASPTARAGPQQQQQQQQSFRQAAAATPSSGTASLPDLTPYLGLPLRLTLNNDRPPVAGLLFAHDPSTGLVVLETGADPTAESRSYPAKAAAAPTARRQEAVAAAQGGTSRRAPTGFQLIKERTIKDVTVIPADASASDAVNGSAAEPKVYAKALSDVTPVNVALAEKREAAATREAQARASRIGVGVSEVAQDVFEGLSKTMPCRWHEKHIIVMDEIILSEPYDQSSLRVPQYSQALLEKLVHPSSPDVPQSELPAGETITTAKGKARRWERVGRVLAGERAKIDERRKALESGGVAAT